VQRRGSGSGSAWLFVARCDRFAFSVIARHGGCRGARETVWWSARAAKRVPAHAGLDQVGTTGGDDHVGDVRGFRAIRDSGRALCANRASISPRHSCLTLCKRISANAETAVGPSQVSLRPPSRRVRVAGALASG